MITKFKIFERKNDPEKIQFAEDFWILFLDYCGKNIDDITKTLLSEAYYKFKIDDTNFIITIDDILGPLGQYNDDTKTLTIGFYKQFEQFLGGLEQLDDLKDYERESISDGIKYILTEPTYNKEITRLHNKVKQTFIHEIIHHYDNLKYGKGYAKSVDKLEDTRSNITNDDEMYKYYYNMPHEIDTHFLTAISQLLDNHGTGYGDFNTFFDMFLEYFQPYKELSDDNKKKIRKRAYSYYAHLDKISPQDH